MKSLLNFFIILLILGNISCNQSADYSEGTSAAHYDELAVEASQDLSNDNITLQRKIIKEGSISFETANALETKDLINQTVEEHDGYISDENVTEYNDKIEYRVTIRIASEKFEQVIESISQEATKLDSKNIYSLDVTEEFIDIEARLNTKKELEKRYIELLKQANKVDEILSIEKEIGTLRAEIESLEGRLNYLKNRVSLSTLTVMFYEKTSPSFGFNSKISQAIHNGWTNLLWFFIAIINLWPFILVGIAIIFIVKVLKRRHKSRKIKL